MAQKIHIIGDVHGKIDELDAIVSKIPSYELVFQLGDLGLGFYDVPNYYSNFYFIRGNHDSPSIAKTHKNYLGDYGSMKLSNSSDKIFFISGADSVDKKARIENVSWWHDEQLEYSILQDAIDQCIEFKPDILLTHDCPYFLYEEMGITTKSKTSTNSALDILFEKISPAYWFYGHHHKPFDKMINKTRFICVEELGKRSLIINK